MRHSIILLCLAGSLCCSRPRLADEPFPHYEVPDEDWITYEGTLPYDNGVDAHVELSLRPGAPGMPSFYSMDETTSGEFDCKKFSMGTRSQGRYLVLMATNTRILQIKDKQRINALIKADDFRKESFVQEDLYLKISGDHKLVLVDENFRQLAQKYTLIRRTSPLFTVEGYITFYDDTADFFERNTRKTWSVARLGEYDIALKKYNSVSKERFEGVYIKALSYSVRSVDRSGKEIDALVFKKLLERDSLQSYTE